MDIGNLCIDTCVLHLHHQKMLLRVQRRMNAAMDALPCRLNGIVQKIACQHLEEIDLGHRRYAHDLKNCMVSIAALAADGGNEEILSLLGDIVLRKQIFSPCSTNQHSM